jgi:hypothetical protein
LIEKRDAGIALSVSEFNLSDTASAKILLLSRFSAEVQKIIKEERDIVLRTVKIK